MWPVFAFDNYFKNVDRTYTLAERWDRLKSFGYQQGYLSINPNNPESWDDFLHAHGQADRCGMSIAAFYTIVEPRASLNEWQKTAWDMLTRLRPGDTLELAVSMGWKKEMSNSALDAEAIAFLQPYLKEAKQRGVTLSLYHHFGFWLERSEDCVRIARQVDDPVLRTTFCGYHWYAIEGTNLTRRLHEAAPFLHLVNVCGSRRETHPRAPVLPATIEPVGAGDFPLAEFIKTLVDIRYTGSVGFQGYEMGGDADANLRQSIAAWNAAVQHLPVQRQ